MDDMSTPQQGFNVQTSPGVTAQGSSPGVIPFLKMGSVIGITCPASYVAAEKVDNAAAILQKWGFRIKRGQTVGTDYNYFSGTDKVRRDDLQAMLDDPEVEAILMGRGGYGMSRIIDDLDFTEFVKNPKWVCGFSDIVVLHNHLQSLFNMPSIHSPMCGAFKPETEHEEYLRTFYAALTGESIFYHTQPSAYNRIGEAEGLLTGGNLSILEHLTGSVSEVDTDGKILFLEDVGEHFYKVDRMMLNLKRAGKLRNLKGLIIGGFTEMEDTERPFGQTVEEIIWDKVKEYDYPVCFNFPCGHQQVNYTITLNTLHKLRVTETGGSLELRRH